MSERPMVLISCDDSTLEQIRRHGSEAYPEECCGVLLGTTAPGGDWSITGLVPMENRHADSRRNRFLIGPEDILRAEQQGRVRSLDLVGFYHSHPDAEARPSGFDLEHAWPWYLYVIASVRSGQPAGLACWQLDDDRSRFHPVALVPIDRTHV